MKKRMLIMIIALIIVFGGIFGFDFLKSHMIKEYLTNFVPPPVVISASKAKSETWQDTIKSVGSLSSYNSVQLTAQQPGQIDKIFFKSGTLVKKGQALLGQNTSVDEQTLKSDKASLELASINYQRDLKLAKKSFVSKSTLDQAQANMLEAEANLAKTATIIRQKTIRAPFTGKIGIRQANLGQYVSLGDKLTTLSSLNPLRAIFSTPEQNMPQVKKGLKVSVKVDAFPDRTFPGVVTAIDSEINSQTRNFQIEAKVPNSNHNLYPGMFAAVSIDLPNKQNVITVPETAITYNLYGDSVYVLTPTKAPKQEKIPGKAAPKPITEQVYKAKTIYVTLGDQRPNAVAVTKGIKAGDMVVTSGQLKLHNGSDVTINNKINVSKTPSTINPEE